MHTVICHTPKPSDRAQIEALISSTNIHCQFMESPPKATFYLSILNNALILNQTPNSSYLCVDFNSSAIRSKIDPQAQKPDLIKAVEGKLKRQLNIIDMTAGLGQDSFMLAARGHKVTALEHSPYPYLLFKDALMRAEESALYAIAQNITLLFANSTNYKANRPQDKDTGFDIAYLDPMFPERQKSAKVKKNMQFLQQLHGETNATLSDNNSLLLHKASEIAQSKVIVKRPRKGDMLCQKQPTSQIIGKSSRFDIYQLTK